MSECLQSPTSAICPWDGVPSWPHTFIWLFRGAPVGCLWAPSQMLHPPEPTIKGAQRPLSSRKLLVPGNSPSCLGSFEALSDLGMGLLGTCLIAAVVSDSSPGPRSLAHCQYSGSFCQREI